MKSPTILQEPHPLLRTVCADVETFDAELAHLVDQMKFAMERSSVRALGLAANQIGETKRVIVVVQDGQFIPMVNPVIEKSSGIQTVRDGCLSVKWGSYFRARNRPAFVCVEYQDLAGQSSRRRARGMHAAVIAHEVDHLNGVLFTDEIEKAA